MSLLLYMVEQNLPLYRWQEYVKPEEPLRYSGWSSKNLEKTVRIIVNGLSSPEVVELVAEEFNSLPPLVRMALTNECQHSPERKSVRQQKQRNSEIGPAPRGQGFEKNRRTANRPQTDNGQWRIGFCGPETESRSHRSNQSLCRRLHSQIAKLFSEREARASKREEKAETGTEVGGQRIG